MLTMLQLRRAASCLLFILCAGTPAALADDDPRCFEILPHPEDEYCYGGYYIGCNGKCCKEAIKCPYWEELVPGTEQFEKVFERPCLIITKECNLVIDTTEFELRILFFGFIHYRRTTQAETCVTTGTRQVGPMLPVFNEVGDCITDPA